MEKDKSGFTLSELLIALGVIGVLSAILLPIIFYMLPNQNIVMARRAFNIAQAAVYDLINDEVCYPDMTRLSTGAKVGFDDGEGHKKCRKWDESKSADSCEKFAVLFSYKIASQSYSKNTSFKTKDGIEWKISGDGTDDGVNYILIDVNGSDKGTNCSTKTSSCTKDWDKFQIKVNPNGKMEIGNAWARNAVKVDSDFVGDGSGDILDGGTDTDFIQ